MPGEVGVFSGRVWFRGLGPEKREQIPLDWGSVQPLRSLAGRSLGIFGVARRVRSPGEQTNLRRWGYQWGGSRKPSRQGSASSSGAAGLGYFLDPGPGCCLASRGTLSPRHQLCPGRLLLALDRP